MENPISGQLIEAAATLLTGLALGLVYDVFRVLRERARLLLLPLALDALFCLLTASALFLRGMGPGRGELRLYMPVVCALGALVYFALFGGAVRASLRRGLDALKAAAIFLLRTIKKFFKILKNIFSSIKKWFIMKREILYEKRAARERAEAFR